MNENEETTGAGISPAPRQGEAVIADILARMGEMLEALRAAESDGIGDLDALAVGHLPLIRGAASNPENCGAIGALVYGRKLIPPGDAYDHHTDAQIALQLGRVYLDGLGFAAADLLTIAGIVAARDNSRHVGSEKRAGRERRSENGRLMQAFSQMPPEDRAALLAQVEDLRDTLPA